MTLTVQRKKTLTERVSVYNAPNERKSQEVPFVFVR